MAQWLCAKPKPLRDTPWAMSEQFTGSELVARWQRAVQAGNVRDIDTTMGFYTSDAEYDVSSVGMGNFEGRTAIRRLFEDWWDSFEEYQQEAEETRDLGNAVTFSIIVMRGKPLHSSAWVEQRYGAVATWRDGLIERTVNTFDISEARAGAERLAAERT